MDSKDKSNKGLIIFIVAFASFVALMWYCSERDKNKGSETVQPSPSFRGSTISTGIECWDCNGRKNCAYCAGKGGRLDGGYYVQCSHCNGTGTCPTCNGIGKLYY